MCLLIFLNTIVVFKDACIYLEAKDNNDLYLLRVVEIVENNEVQPSTSSDEA